MKSAARWIRVGAATVVAVGVIAVMMVMLAGGFRERIQPGQTAVGMLPLRDAPTTAVALVTVPVVEEAVGTVRAGHETSVGAKVLARVVSVNAVAGQLVDEGAVLIELERGDLEARVQQARAAVDVAQAALDQSQTDFDRIERLRGVGSASELEFTRATNDLNAARATVEAAESVLREAETFLGYATIRSPLTGVVIDKLVDVGDMVQPGQPVFRLYDQLQLVATVRESLATRLQVSQSLPVTLEALDLRCEGVVSEIVPESDALSRAFEVKVTGPCPPGVIPGMFGRLTIPLGQREEVRIPRSAVRHIGQIPVVYRVVEDDRVERAFIQIAGTSAEHVAVASGLSPGDLIVTDPDRLQPPSGR
jgi:RND family efflux transporter MFP subunit